MGVMWLNQICSDIQMLVATRQYIVLIHHTLMSVSKWSIGKTCKKDVNVRSIVSERSTRFIYSGELISYNK